MQTVIFRWQAKKVRVKEKIEERKIFREGSFLLTENINILRINKSSGVQAEGENITNGNEKIMTVATQFCQPFKAKNYAPKNHI